MRVLLYGPGRPSIWTLESLENEVCAKVLLSRALGLVPGRIRWHLRREVFATTDPFRNTTSLYSFN
jgi:hypothetical protein